MDIYGEWIELAREISNCEKCGKGSKCKFICGGEKNARIMVVLQRPDNAWLESGNAYCGENGEFLKEVFRLSKIDDEGIYLTFLLQSANIVNSYKQSEENCIQFLRRQFKLVSPEIIVTVGEAVSKRLIGGSFDFRKDRAKPIGKGKVMFFAVSDPFVPFGKEQRDEFLNGILNVAEFCKTYPSYKCYEKH